MSNIIFIQDIDTNRKDNTGLSHIHGRTWSDKLSPYKYSIASWKKWAKKNDCEVLIMEDLLCDTKDMGICWQRYYVFDMLEQQDIKDYDKILIVDADTIVHPDCPNFFDMAGNKYAGVRQEGSMDWVVRSMEQFSRFVHEGYMIPYDRYINAGFQIINKSHKKFFKEIIDFYNTNKNEINEVQHKFGVGSDQTNVNLLLNKKNIDFKFLPYEFNMTALYQKEILDEDLTFTKLGWVYHFCSIPDNWDNNKTLYWMKKTYEYFYGALTNEI
tara:strand:+ start:619 stop:1428 length:810 start_codon:yes stop_codon:yes gene_type:complete